MKQAASGKFSASRSFDRVAEVYDQTRPFPEAAARLGTTAILEHTGRNARILDAGTGTGRVSIPLIDQGADLYGLDLSPQMLKQLRQKKTDARILQANATRIPFPDDTFDAVLTVHVLHLIPAWKEVLSEIQRVLQRQAVYLDVKTYQPGANSIRKKARLFWRDWLESNGVMAIHTGVENNQELLAELEHLGAKTEEVDTATYTLPFTPHEELGRFRNRIYSETWELSDRALEASTNTLEAWMTARYGALEQELLDTVRFRLLVARFGRGLL